MKKLFPMLLVSLVLLQPAFAQVTEEKDRFTGETTFSYQSKISSPAADEMLGPPTMIVLAIHTDDAVSYSLMVSTAFSTSRGGGWRYLNVTKIDWLVDGVLEKFSEPVVDRRAESGFVMETFVQDLSSKEFVKLSNAKLVEFRIGSDEFLLSEADLAALREVLGSKPTGQPTS